MADHAWTIFARHPDVANTTLVQEFYTHGPSPITPFVFCRGQPVALDEDTINAYYGIQSTEDENSDFVAALTAEGYDALKEEHCLPGTTWPTGKNRGSAVRKNLLPQQKI